jgi:CheY-like chemotaxis protein
MTVSDHAIPWRLLLVDDDDRDYRLVCELLAQGLPGTTIERVTTLSDACREAAATDCVLLDIGLPGTDGTMGVKRLTQEAPDTAIVVLTAATREELGAASLSAGAQDYLVKRGTQPSRRWRRTRDRTALCHGTFSAMRSGPGSAFTRSPFPPTAGHRHGYAPVPPRGLPTGVPNRLRSRPPVGGSALLTGPHPRGWSRRRD